MNNLRIVYDNRAARSGTTITASSTAGGLSASNLANDLKSSFWRSAGTTESLTVVFPEDSPISVVALPICNLTNTATIRVRGYANPEDLIEDDIVDSGIVLACPNSFAGIYGFGLAPLGANGFAYGDYSYASVWIPETTVRKLIVDIVDTASNGGKIEAAFLVAGNYWSPENNAEYGVQIGFVESTRNERSDAGDIRTDRGTMHKTVNFDLNYMPNSDRNALWRVLRLNGMHTPVFVSLMPDDTDGFGEQIFQVYGKLSRQSQIRFQYLNQFNSSLEIEEV